MSFKAFVSESEINEIREKKQAEWDKKRAAAGEEAENMPVVRPEEEIDFRSLAERLEENRMKKEEEHAEKYKLSNMIYSGMDDDEFEHIEKLEEKKREDEKQKRAEEAEAYRQFQTETRKLPEEDAKAAAAAPKARVIKKGLKNKKPSALSALKASIKLKPKPKASDGASMKRPAGSTEEAPAKRAKEAAKPAAPTTGLGGLAAYSDSDSD